MKVAHWTVITPNKCGLYETTREIVKGMRDQGVDSRMVDPDGKMTITDDRGAKIDSIDWAMGADVFVNHSGLGLYEKMTKQPIVHLCHGRPRYSFNGERDGGPPVYSYQYRKGKEERFTPVTLWEDHIPYHKAVWGQEIKYINPCVDLDFWKPEGPKFFKSGTNYVITDSWRSDLDPWICILAFINSNVDAKLSLFGVQERRGLDVLFKILQDQNRLGVVKPWVKGLDSVYRSADCLLTPHKIATRAVRESMACGCPVIYVNHPSTNLKVIQTRETARKNAEMMYNIENTAKQLKDLCFQVHKRHQLAA